MPKRRSAAGAEDGGMQVITRVAAVLDALARPEGAQSLGQLAARTGLPKTTVHRICGALEQVGYVRTDAVSGRRELGPALLRLATAGRSDVAALLQPSLRKLSEELNETVDLAVLDGTQVLFVAQNPAPARELMAIARVGASFPAYSLASGKVLLAGLPREDVLRRLPPRLEPALDGRARTRESVLEELETVRETGLGYECEEMRHGICAIAVAVSAADGRTASIAVPMPTSRFEQSRARVAARLLALRDEAESRLRGV